MTDKKRRTVKQFIATIKAMVDLDFELLNKQSSEVDRMRGQVDLLDGMLRDTQKQYESAKDTLRGSLESYRELSARVEGMRDLLKDFEKNGDE